MFQASLGLVLSNVFHHGREAGTFFRQFTLKVASAHVHGGSSLFYGGRAVFQLLQYPGT